jgi:hypothetical protein
MVCSAPEMTTVSKPKRKPARAEVIDQKKMRPFMVWRLPDGRGSLVEFFPEVTVVVFMSGG